jgi:small subunit ribosomal protein S15
MSVTKERKSELVKDYGRAGSDTGSPEVQVAILTSRVAEMTKHLQLHKKDVSHAHLRRPPTPLVRLRA